MNRSIQTLAIIAWMMLSFNANAIKSEMHFWPTPIKAHDTERDGTLFGWPHFSVLLSEKLNDGNYAPAQIDNQLKEKMDDFFPLEPDDVIERFYDPSTAQWGFRISGGNRLKPQHKQMIEPITQAFILCLNSLSSEQIHEIKTVFYAPATHLPGGENYARPQLQQAVNAMETNYKKNRCSKKNFNTPDLVKDKINLYISNMIDSSLARPSITDGEFLVFTNTFHDFLFSKDGVWVRTALKKIHEFLEKAIKNHPSIEDKQWLNKNYESFIDYILLTFKQSGYDKNHYLSIARKFKITSIFDMFNNLKIKDSIDSGHINIIDIYIAKIKSNYLF